MTTSIKLYGIEKAADTPSTSGFCHKLETFFRATGFKDYTHQSTLPMSAPKGKVPYIDLVRDGKTERIADSHFIICKLVEEKVVPDLDADLTTIERGETRSWQAWTEELIYSAVVYTRWGYPANYAVIATEMPGPSLVRPVAAFYFRRKILQLLWAGGIARHTNEEVEKLMREYVDALDARLDETYFFRRSDPTLIDVVLYGFLSNAISQASNPEYRAMLLSSERIKKYTANLTKKWFPEHKALLAAVEN